MEIHGDRPYGSYNFRETHFENEFGRQGRGTRATLEAARCLLGKIYLYQEKYADAKSELEKVISSGKYDLIADVSTFYHPASAGCKEYVLECVRHYDPSNMYSQEGWFGILANWGFGYGFIAGPEASMHYKFNTTSGYSYFNPSKSLYDAFVAEEGADGYRLNAWIRTWEQVIAMNIAVNTTTNKYASEGYFRLKWLASTDDEFVGYWCGNQSNTPVIRYADVLLMAAEACLQAGDQAGADEYLGRVRDRARLPRKSHVTLSDIKLERRLELAMEGMRFQDLKRWGMLRRYWRIKGKSYRLSRLYLTRIMTSLRRQASTTPVIRPKPPMSIMKSRWRVGLPIATSGCRFLKMNWR